MSTPVLLYTLTLSDIGRNQYQVCQWVGDRLEYYFLSKEIVRCVVTNIGEFNQLTNSMFIYMTTLGNQLASL